MGIMQAVMWSKLKPILAVDSFLETHQTANQIVEARKQLGISQKALAIEMGIGRPYLCDLEYGRRRWTMERFKKAKASLQRLSGHKSK